MEFPPLGENPTNRDLGVAVYKVHECLEASNARHDKADAVATLERQNLRKGQFGIAREIKKVKEGQLAQAEDISYVKTAVEKYERWIAEAMKWVARFRRWRKGLWGVALFILGSIAASAISVVVTAVMAVSTPHVTDQKAPSRYTAQDAARDHAAQAKVDREIIDQLAALKAAQPAPKR